MISNVRRSRVGSALAVCRSRLGRKVEVVAITGGRQRRREDNKYFRRIRGDLTREFRWESTDKTRRRFDGGEGKVDGWPWEWAEYGVLGVGVKVGVPAATMGQARAVSSTRSHPCTL